jgi:hypothetical protein
MHLEEDVDGADVVADVTVVGASVACSAAEASPPTLASVDVATGAVVVVAGAVVSVVGASVVISLSALASVEVATGAVVVVVEVEFELAADVPSSATQLMYTCHGWACRANQ